MRIRYRLQFRDMAVRESYPFPGNAGYAGPRLNGLELEHRSLLEEWSWFYGDILPSPMPPPWCRRVAHKIHVRWPRGIGTRTSW
jgi:hypothetical protein